MPDDAPFTYTREFLTTEDFKVTSTISTSPKEISVKDGQTPLIAAASNGSVAAIQLLLSRGAKINTPDAGGCTALYHAVCARHRDAVEALLTAGADPGIVCRSGANVLHAASFGGDANVVELLSALDRVDLMVNDHAGRTPVAYAAAEGNVRCTEILCSAYKLLTPREINIEKAFVLAAENGHQDVVDLIVSRYGVEAAAECLPSAFVAASRIGHTGIVTTILNCGNISSSGFELALNEAAKHAHQAVLDLMWKHEPDEMKRQSGQKAGKWTALIWAAKAGKTSVVDFLLKMGWDPNTTSIEFFTPLIGAVESGCEDTVITLLKHGADPNRRTVAGYRGVILAAKYGYLSIMKALLDAGADAERKTASGGFTPLMLAAKNGHDAIVNILLAYKASVDTRSSDGSSALALSAQHGHVLCAKALLEAGADKNLDPSNTTSKDKGRPPLILAVDNEHGDMVELLLSFEVNIECTDNTYFLHDTPVEIAAKAGNERIVGSLLGAGAQQRDRVFKIAYKRDNKKIIGWLMADGIDAAGILDSALETYNPRTLRDKSHARSKDQYEIFNTDEFTEWPTTNWDTQDRIIGRLMDPNLEVTSMAWSEWPDIIWAADVGKLDEVETLLKDGADANAAVSNGHTALMSSAAHGHTEVCRVLLAHGADPNSHASGCTPLILAARNGYANTVSELLINGANPGLKIKPEAASYEPENNGGWDAYLAAACHGHITVLRSLPEPAVEFDFELGDLKRYSIKSPVPDMAIYFAAMNGHDETVRYLISRGAQVNITAEGDERPISVAAHNGHYPVVATLLEAGATHDIESSSWRQYEPSPLVQAVKMEHIDVVKLLLLATPPYPDATKAVALSMACATGNLPMVMALIRAGTDVAAAIPSNHDPPILMATESQQIPILEAIIEASAGKESTYGFLRYRQAIDASDSWGVTALINAARIGRLDMVQTLLEAGADIDICNDRNCNALMTAALDGHRDIVRFLIQRGCRIDTTDKHDRSALGFACDRGDIEIVQDLISAGANVSPDARVTTPLIMATKKNHMDVVEALISAGAAVDNSIRYGFTALIEASSRGFPDMVHLLLRAGASVSAALWDEWTPLALASRDGHVEVVTALLAAGADPNVEISGGYTPLALAARHGHLSVVECILDSSKCPVTTLSCGSAILAAAGKGNSSIVEKLLSYEVVPRVVNSVYKDAVVAATKNGFEELASAIHEYLEKHASMLDAPSFPGIPPVDANADKLSLPPLSQEDPPASTPQTSSKAVKARNPLFDAISEANNATAKDLIKSPDATLIASDGLTALHVAARHANLAMIEATLEYGIDVNSQVVEDLYGVEVREHTELSPPLTFNKSPRDLASNRFRDEARKECKTLNPLLCNNCLFMIPPIADLESRTSNLEQQLSFKELLDSAVHKCPGCAMHLSYLFSHYGIDELQKNMIYRTIVTHGQGRDGGLGGFFEVQSLIDDGSNSNRSLRFTREGVGLDDQSPADIQKRLAQRNKLGPDTTWDFQTMLVQYRLGEKNVQTCKFVVYADEGKTTGSIISLDS
jgi:ankyrin repeat protein